MDATVGAGGHAAALMEACVIKRYIGIDRDESALEIARQKLCGHSGVHLVRDDFRNLPDILRSIGVMRGQVGGFLLDAGMSSMQLDTAERGFSFMRDGPLDMRMSISNASFQPTAADLVNQLDVAALESLFLKYGEEPRARAMADRIVHARQREPIMTTTQLAEVLSGGRRKTSRGIHPATLCFQALRIAVNGELDALSAVIPNAVEHLEPANGLMAIISFHSLEDRIVKRTFRDMSKMENGVAIITKRPIIADDNECKSNPRSRSAKMRIARRLGLGESPRVGKVNKYRAKT